MKTRWKRFALITALAALPLLAAAGILTLIPEHPLVAKLLQTTTQTSAELMPQQTGMTIAATANADTLPTPTPTPTPELTPTPIATAPAAPAIKSVAPKVAAAQTKTTVKAPDPKPTIVAKPAAAPTCSGGYTEQFICLLNQYRASKGKGKVSLSSGLSKVALSHSQWMNSTGIFSHTGEGGSRFNERCSAAGITCRAENLAMGAGSAQNLLNMWKNSAGHNANLLGPYTTIGIGVAGSYTTALFN